MSILPRCLVLLAALLASGCATLAPSPPSDDCARWFAQLDAAVDATGVRDAQDERIEGFAGLRVDRFGAATRGGDFDAWLSRAAALDLQARDAEIANLPASAFPIDGAADAPSARERSQRCRSAWAARLAAPGPLRSALLERATVPDRYATALRAAGLYPLLRWPFFTGVNAWQQGHEQAMSRWQRIPPPVQRFVPDDAADAHAPLFEIETDATTGALAAFDRFGVPAWRAEAGVPDIDTTRAVVYRRESQTLYRGQVLRQQVYTLWFSERPRRGAFDLLGGALDGVMVRLTLAPDGRVLMLDTIHACGCYHLFFPADGVALREGAPRHEEWAFVPAQLPPLAPGQRLVVRIASATHYVTGLVATAARDGTAYALRDENDLRSLPLPGGGARSFYRPDGLVAGSERGERFLFWPMGIASAGAMRQWGHHATAFVGRRHFDDADLIERRFVILPLK
jgi:hypothetical protein